MHGSVHGWCMAWVHGMGKVCGLVGLDLTFGVWCGDVIIGWLLHEMDKFYSILFSLNFTPVRANKLSSLLKYD